MGWRCCSTGWMRSPQLVAAFVSHAHLPLWLSSTQTVVRVATASTDPDTRENDLETVKMAADLLADAGSEWLGVVWLSGKVSRRRPRGGGGGGDVSSHTRVC
eukprot:GHVU01006215.1.p1 GENE.GHVU01006215.1~~GHVU01006215.1.p1  ORF type:complete len:102 (-),score=7.33 GHVU01006215.1:283-588(-)